jgi:integrase
MRKSTRHGRKGKPAKPYPEFPLFPHATKRWAKKIKGKMCYFGPWSDPDGALKKYLEQKDDLFAGRVPRARTDELTLRDLVNRFLTHKRHLADTREIAERTFTEYHAVCELLVETFGRLRPVVDLGAEDFEGLRAKLAKTLGPVRLGNEIQRVRSVFKYGYDAGLLDRPVRFGPGFKRPSQKTLRVHRASKGLRMFEADQIRAILDAAGVQLGAMILCGINCGFGNADVGRLPLAALDLDAGWVNFPRPKTGIPRRCPLWPQTVAAIREALARRPTPKDPSDAGLVFITKYGEPWAKADRDNPVAKETTKLLKTLGMDRPGLGFYCLRHTFETIGGEARDQVVVDAIMGHAPDGSDMASVYRERISDGRLRAVTDHVRAWLFAKAKKAPETPAVRADEEV